MNSPTKALIACHPYSYDRIWAVNWCRRGSVEISRRIPDFILQDVTPEDILDIFSELAP
jgi:hypothetical protein